MHKSTRSKNRVFIYFLVETEQEVGSDHNTANSDTCELPKCYTPAIKHFDLSQSILKLMLNVCDFIVNPFVQPTHFELSDTVKKILQYFESPCSQTYVFKPYLIDFSSYLQRFIHHKACDRYPKKQRKTDFESR